MLVLTRKPTEGIVIGEDIRIYVNKVQGKQVQIRIDAPKDMKIDRIEVREAQEKAKETKS